MVQLGLSAVSAAASVATLGVCIAGFVITNQRLKALQRDVARMERVLVGKIDDVREAVERVEHQLVRATAAIQGDIALLAEEVRGLRRDFEARQYAQVAAAFEGLVEEVRRTGRPAEDELRHARRVARELLTWITWRLQERHGLASVAGVEEVVLVQWYRAAAMLLAASEFHLACPAEAAERVGKAADDARLPVADLCWRTLPVVSVGESRRAEARGHVGPYPFGSLEEVERAHPAGMLSGWEAGGRPDGSRLRDRALVAASLADSLVALDAFAAELAEGEPRVVDPLADWRPSEESGADAPVLVVLAGEREAA